MSRLSLSAYLLAAFVLALGCSKDTPTMIASDSCVSGDARCGLRCDDTHGCGAGLFCSASMRCAQQCDPENPCDGGKACSKDGRCTTSVEVDASVVDSGKPDSTFDDDDAGQSFAGTGAPICADKTVSAQRVKPTVVLIIDQSSSMHEDFDGLGSRWNVLRDFLLDDAGLIASFQDQVRFGLAMYSADSDRDSPLPVTPIGECPRVSGVSPALGNFDAIETAYRATEPIEDTPTGDAIDKVLADLALDDDPDAERDPIVFVLATDGEPDTCEQLDPQEGQQEAIDAVSRAFDAKIKTFVIAVGNDVSETHQQDIANAGLGRGPADEPAEFWRAGDDATLRQSLTEIIGGQVSCDITLDGSVAQSDACKGTVLLNGKTLPCEDDDGFTWVDSSHIRLQGKACDHPKTLQTAMLHVTFPCGVQVVD